MTATIMMTPIPPQRAAGDQGMTTDSQPMQPPEHHTPTAVVIAAVMAAFSSLAAALMPAVQEVSAQAQEVIRALNVNVMDDARLRLVCLAGSLGGGLLSIMIFPLPTTKALVGKLFASGIAGMMFSPMVMRWSSLPLDTDMLLFVSCVVALLSYTLLQGIVPMANRFIEKWFGSKLDTTPYDVEDGRPHAPLPDVDATNLSRAPMPARRRAKDDPKG